MALPEVFYLKLIIKCSLDEAQRNPGAEPL